MAIQIPEPDYYTLAEVAERWGVSEDVLLRLGAEDKIKYGYYSEHFIEARLSFIPSPNRPYRFPLFSITQEEVEAFGWASPMASIRGLFSLSGYLIRRIIYDGKPHYLGPIKFYGEVSAVINPDGPRVDSLPPGTHLVANQHAIYKSDLVIPTKEIHRIEHQHEAAEQAADDDILGTKDKEKYQGMIAAMAQIIASKAPGYKHGDKPNAAQIAEAIASTGITERQPATMAKEISKATQLFGK